jgi:deazaflavin-dependent oxidoreductase (nitroreductase family)
LPTAIGNFFIGIIINSPLHSILGDSFAVISLTGRKSGRKFSTPINVADLDGELTVVSFRQRNWWRNLRGGRPALLRHGGRRYPVRGEIVEEPSEVAAGLARYFARYPAYARYFKVRLGPDGRPDGADLEAAAHERVLIRLAPE